MNGRLRPYLQKVKARMSALGGKARCSAGRDELELLTTLASDDDALTRSSALEGLASAAEGAGDKHAAAMLWWRAAQAREVAGPPDVHLRRLYERVLELAPDTLEAAEALVMVLVRRCDWDRVPEALGIILRADPDRGAVLLLSFETSALRGRAGEALVAMVDEAAALRPPASELTLRLRRAKARALAAIPGREADAAATYRAVIEAFAEDEDVHELLALLESTPPAALTEERRWVGRWLDARIAGGAPIEEAAVLVERLARDGAAGARRLVRLRLRQGVVAGRRQADVLADLAAETEDAAFAVRIQRALLVQSAGAMRKAFTDDEFDAAADAAERAIDALKTRYLAAGASARAARLLLRGARLLFDRARQRTLLHQASLLYADALGDGVKAARLFDELFQENDADAIAASIFERFVTLLDALGRHTKLAFVWEAAARRAERAADEEEAKQYWLRAGRLWERLGVDARAAAAFRRGAALGCEEALEALALRDASSGRFADAAASFKYLSVYGDPARRDEHLLRLAEALLELGEPERACEHIEGLVRCGDGFTASTRPRIKEIYRRAARFRPLVGLLRAEAFTSPPADAVALLREAAEISRAELGDVEGALRLLELAAARDPASADVHAALADLYEGQRRWEDVVRVLRAHAPARNAVLPASVHLRRRLVECLLSLGRRDDAITELKASARLFPLDASIFAMLGRLEREGGDLVLAERALRAALHVAPRAERVELLLELVSVALAQSDRGRAANLLESAFDAAVSSSASAGGREHARALAAAALAVGQAHLAEDELVEASDVLRAGCAADPADDELALLVALVAHDLGEDTRTRGEPSTVGGAPSRRRTSELRLRRVQPVARASGQR